MTASPHYDHESLDAKSIDDRDAHRRASPARPAPAAMSPRIAFVPMPRVVRTSAGRGPVRAPRRKP